MHFLTFVSGFLLLSANFKNGYCYNVKKMYYWKEITFENLPLRDDAYIGRYPYFIPTNNVVMAISFHAQSGLMVTTVGRLREGVPSTLNAFCTSDYSEGVSPHLWGFPNYEINTLEASDYETTKTLRHKHQNNNQQPSILRLISVYHPTVDDRCHRLFIIDTGVVRTKDDTRYHVQRASIVVFELPSNGCISRNFPLIRKIEIPDGLWKDAVGFVYLTLDFQSKGGCNDVIMYITNIFDNTIIVYDYAKNDFWMFGGHPSFQPVESETYIWEYQIQYGVITMTLGWPDSKGNRIAYYAPGASTAAYAVTTKTLKNRRKSNGSEFRMIGYQGCGGNRHRQFLDLSCGVMFFAEMNLGAVKCWNVAKPYNPNNLGVVYQSQDKEVITDLFVDSEGYLWILSNQIHLIFASQKPLNLNQLNARVYKVRTLDAILGTVCENDGIVEEEISWQYMIEK